MTHNNPQLFQNRCSTREFLFSKTDKKEHDKKPEQKYSGLDKLKKEFPDILFDRSFIDSALDKLDSFSQFGAIIMQVDHLDAMGEEQLTRTLLDAARIIDAECKNRNGIWGKIDGDIVGCVLPDVSESLCLELAGQTMQKLTALNEGTVSIGIASYPTLNYEKASILENADKALQHAELLGAGSTVVFDAVSLNISGDRLYQEGDINGAIEEFKSALMLDPGNVNVHNSLGVCYGILGAYEKAMKHFEQAVSLDPAEVMALYNAGLINILINNHDKALEWLLKADATGEDVFEVAFHAGKLFFDKGEFKRGRRQLEKAVRLRPRSGTACRYLGECYMAVHMVDEAVAAYKKAIKNNPNDAASLSALGYLFDVQGENPDITTIFSQQSIDIEPENGLFRNRLGRLYFKQNQLEDALYQLEKANALGYDSMELIEKIQNLMMDGQSK